MFARKLVSRKACGSTHSENAQLLLVWFYRFFSFGYSCFMIIPWLEIHRLFETFSVIYLVTSALAAYTSGVFKPTVYDLNNSSSWNTKFVKHLSYAAIVCFKGREARTSILISAPLRSTTWIRKTSRFLWLFRPSTAHVTIRYTITSTTYGAKTRAELSNSFHRILSEQRPQEICQKKLQ